MATDIELPANSEVINLICKRVDVLASDLVLDSSARRKPNGPRFRRALVHDENDGLTVNFAGDYPGGVTVVNVAHVFPVVKRRDDGHAETDKPYPTFTVHGRITYETEQLVGDPDGDPNETHTITVIIDEAFNTVFAELAKLRARIEALEART
jgi:hypothetical protein